MAMLRAVGRVAAATVPAAQLARLGLPALAGGLGLAVLALVTVWWVLASDARCERLAKVVGAWRGVPTARAAVPSTVRARSGWWRRGR
jgi:hypothetical protein